MFIESVKLSNHLIVCYLLFLLPSVFPSIRIFSNVSVLHIKWPVYWNFSFSISPSNEYSELISFRIDWFNLAPVQRTLKSHLQHHSSKTSILWCLAFFMVQLSYPWASLVAQMVKNLPAVRETWGPPLGWEDPLEKGTATHSSNLAWKIPWTEKPGMLQSMGSERVGHDWVTFIFTFSYLNMTTGKTIALPVLTFVNKVMSAF